MSKKEKRRINKNNKDTVFRMVFREPGELLSLYNAVNGTCYEDPDELEITTLENAVYMNMKNDVSCVLDMRMNLYEHQSTVNPNMPLRNFFYTARLYEKIIVGKDLYSSRQILLPIPRYITFYNGMEKQPEKRTMKLSDSFAQSGEVNLELKVVQLNINPGYNEELKKNCPALCQYMKYVEKTRVYKEMFPIEEAIEMAVDECIKEGILREFLIKNKAEAIQMSIFEYDEELHKRTLREEGYEDGLKHGMERGMKRGIEHGMRQAVLELLEDLGSVPEDIRKKLHLERNLETLKKWHKAAARAESMEQFRDNM
ncbi:MAG: hypothetical protein NC412_12120 [Roseburia sp.]|nr:hypothetical protein [Roseburia sp.]